MNTNTPSIEKIIYIIYCALTQTKPDTDIVKSIPLDKLYKLCESHHITAMVCMALESIEMADEQWKNSKGNAIRKSILLDAERKSILAEFEKKKIWYMPLKGIVLKNYYPKLGMREMSDNDILYDIDRRSDVKEIMIARGYDLKDGKGSNHDEYHKAPIYKFEMHHSLFNEYTGAGFYSYYSNIESKLLKDSNNNYSRKFSNEDFYIYTTAHDYRHFINGGTGLRTLTDCYVMLNKFESTLNWEYIEKQSKILGIEEFEKTRRNICKKLFTDSKPQPLSENETRFLNKIVNSGAFGTIDNYVIEKADGSRFRYIIQRVFPPLSIYKCSYPFFYKHKILLPIGFFVRLFRIITRRKKVKAEFQALKKVK